MESEKLWCKYDSTWEEEEEDEEEPPEPQERQRSWWIVSWILGSFLWTWLAKVVTWSPWRWFIFTGRKNQGKNGSDKKHYQRANEGPVRHRNLRAAQDMQTYRHEYPDLDDEDCLDEPNLRFYMNLEKFQPHGILIEDLLRNWNKDYQILEQSHSYIQWLFPLREAGMNWCAQPLSRKELEAFRGSTEVKKRFVRAYKLMLDFYGIELVHDKTGALKRAPHYKERFQNLNWHSHNNLRITRILKCLGEMGYEHFQVKLVEFFLEETLVSGTLPSVKQSALDYFIFTVRNRQCRQMLVHYAWQHYNPQDRFVWGPLEKLKRFKVPKPPKRTSISSTDEEGDEETNAGGEPANVVFINETLNIQTGDSQVQIKEEPKDKDTKKVPGSTVQDFLSAQTPEDLAVKNVSEGEAIHHDEVESAKEQLQPVDGSIETAKEVRKRKLSVTEQEEPSKTLQLEILTSKLTNTEDFGEECTESNEAGTLLPALKKKKEDAKEPVNVSLEKETRLSKVSIPVPNAKEDIKPMLPKAECVQETIQVARNVEGRGLSKTAIIHVSAPVEETSVKDDLTTGKGRLPNIVQESEKAASNEDHIEKQDIEGYQDNIDRNEQITDGGDKTSDEGVKEYEDLEKNSIASLSLKPLGKNQDPEPGGVLGANAEKSNEEAAKISEFLESLPKTLSVCHTVPSEKLANTEDDSTSNAEKSRAAQKVGSTESYCTPNEQKTVSDIKLTQPDNNEHKEPPRDASGGQAKHVLPMERERKFHDSSDDVGANNGTVEQKQCISKQSADGLDVNKTLTHQVGCKPTTPVTEVPERLESLNEVLNCQAGPAANEMKAPGKCKATPTASEEVAKPTLMQLVDCKPVQAAGEMNESQGMAQHHHSKPMQVAKGVEDCSSITEQQDCKCEQTGDGRQQSKSLKEQESLKPDSAAKLKGEQECPTSRPIC